MTLTADEKDIADHLREESWIQAADLIENLAKRIVELESVLGDMLSLASDFPLAPPMLIAHARSLLSHKEWTWSIYKESK